jgi:hypothetical protein
MLNPSRSLSAQNGCPLFKLAAETRNQIYDLVFSFESEKDEEGYINIELSTATAPSNALTRTCQQIHNENHKMFKLATWDYPSKYSFTINVPDRHQRPTVPALSQQFFDDIHAFRITWRADELNNNKPLHLTFYFNKAYGEHGQPCSPSYWAMDVLATDKSWQLSPSRRRRNRRDNNTTRQFDCITGARC